MEGEGYNKWIKEYVKTGLKKGWEKNLLTYLLRRSMMDEIDMIIGQRMGSPGVEGPNQRKTFTGRVHIYDSLVDLLTRARSGYPLSGYVRGGTDYFVVYKHSRQQLRSRQQLVCATMAMGLAESEHTGLVYYKWDLEDGIKQGKVEVVDLDKTDYEACIFLPPLSQRDYPNPNNNYTYCVVTETWRSLSDKRTLEV